MRETEANRKKVVGPLARLPTREYRCFDRGLASFFPVLVKRGSELFGAHTLKSETGTFDA